MAIFEWFISYLPFLSLIKCQTSTIPINSDCYNKLFMMELDDSCIAA